jgi:hypothetical protein
MIPEGHDLEDWMRTKIAQMADDVGEVYHALKHRQDMNVETASEGISEEIESLTARKKGLWDNIRKKRERGEKPANPGDEDYPEKDTWQKLTGKD